MGAVKNILDCTVTELEEYFASIGEPPYRARQLLKWIYGKLATSFDDMSDLPQALRDKLASGFTISCSVPLHESVSRDRFTRKALLRLADGRTIESSLMLYSGRSSRERGTVCVSTQVGCAIGCPFCATGQQGFERNLSAGEIIAQVLHFCRSTSGSATRPVTNVVFMGMGEPLANYDAVMPAIRMLNQHLGIGIRQITVSTAGLAPRIERLARESLPVELSVSLHAADNALRNRLVPVNRKYPLDVLISACCRYFARTGRRLTFEYALFEGVNDSLEQAAQLALLLGGLNCHVNLIAGNPTPGSGFSPLSEERVIAFQRKLVGSGIPATVRVPRGLDIEAGCGQLRSRYLATGLNRLI